MFWHETPSIGFLYHITAYEGHFIVLVGKINMFSSEKLRMELKCHRSDVTDVDVFNVFYHTKTTSGNVFFPRMFKTT